MIWLFASAAIGALCAYFLWLIIQPGMILQDWGWFLQRRADKYEAQYMIRPEDVEEHGDHLFGWKVLGACATCMAPWVTWGILFALHLMGTEFHPISWVASPMMAGALVNRYLLE